MCNFVLIKFVFIIIIIIIIIIINNTPLRNIWQADNPAEVLNELLSLLVRCYVPTKVVRVRNKDKPWFGDQCRHAFGLKQEAHLQ